MSHKLLILSLCICAVLVQSSEVEHHDDDTMEHEYHVHVYHPAHGDSEHHPDDDDKIDVHIHNNHANDYHPKKNQNYVIHIHEDTNKDASSGHHTKRVEHHSSEKDHEHDYEKKKEFFKWQDNIYHFFHEDHEDKYDYAECDLVADTEHSEGVNLTGRVVFKQNRHGGSLHYQVEAHGFEPNHPDHAMHVHQYGDIQTGCTHVGDHYNPTGVTHDHTDKEDHARHIGDFGELHANDHGDILKEYHDTVASLHGPHTILGRALVIDSHTDDAHDDAVHHMACCVIARSPGENWHADWPHN